MIKAITMYTVICDNCGADANSGTDYSCWSDHQYAHDNAMESGFVEHEEKDYCPHCYSTDDNDNVIIDLTRKKS